MNAADAPAAARPRWIKTADVAKLIRRHLKAAFPGQKFSVRSSSYSGGSSIDIGWDDGPVSDQVDAVTRPFSGAGFDGMIDLKYHYESWYCAEHGALVASTYGHSYNNDGGGIGNGPNESRCCSAAELVHFGVDFVHSTRRLSPEFRAELEAAVAKDYGVAYDANAWVQGRWMSDYVYRLSREVSKYVAPAKA